MKRTTRIAAGTGALVAAIVLGLGAGAATAGSFAFLGLSSSPNGAPHPIKAPQYETNAAGETYGSAADATSPENEPDLIRAQATNGKTGYVKKVDLDAANGTTAAESFKSPEDALRWQETEGQLDHTIPVYDVDGVTQIGEFTVVGQKTAQEQAEQAGLDDSDAQQRG